ncbi:MAG: nuclear transport factor 2 family protein [Leclercia adecarboxylata]|uniref:Nuclear transport factor 2 family protein n=1 Tax=Leclercia adecarboxylata TaxID=83655 RepID=A0AAP9DBV4_9ENTR|nr:MULTISPECIES: nuclear transport factor 2 family protein [Leclercia]HCN96771.1 nuclear transport factor 2 family protein [Leclercia sp.]MDK4745280.1 nuclear transport factor 2 family protein [Leclercia adecarboxylata]MDU1059295.1 nuclear transport factor 2 family protein [Leclercia adecarboxylata]MDU1085919.1 nuclear transport factor 2 family protein [Leclercia adecarboxylata]QDK19623.1 nuclear transport factor 2 family protein [Leclercia adecarboxylata]
MSALPSVIDRFVDYYADLDNQPPSALVALYDANAILFDPFGEHKGLFSIQRYFMHLLANVDSCRFTLDPPLYDARRFVVTWTMHWSHPRMAGGGTLSLPGCSFVEIEDDMIVRQRDYYDAGEMIYEHLPLLGWAVRGVKKRVRSG